MTDRDWHHATAAIRAAEQRTDIGEHSPAIFATSSFVFPSAAAAAARCACEAPGPI